MPMPVYPEPTSTDELDPEVLAAEPSHVHIPRPSRRLRMIADDLSLTRLDLTTRCTCLAD